MLQQSPSAFYISNISEIFKNMSHEEMQVEI